jgi:hypothetical protein
MKETIENKFFVSVEHEEFRISSNTFHEILYEDVVGSIRESLDGKKSLVIIDDTLDSTIIPYKILKKCLIKIVWEQQH